MAGDAFHLLYARLYQTLIWLPRRLRVHRWPLVGAIVGDLGVRALRAAHPSVVEVERHELRLDPGDDLDLALRSRHEPVLRQVMERHIPPGGIVVDGGAHIGFHTLRAARLAGPSGRVFAFEPSPATFALLSENLSRNGYTNVVPVNGALAHRSASARLHLSADNTGDHRIAQTEEPREGIEITTHSLDDVLPADAVVDFVKLDVQGAEPLVLAGMKQVLERSPQLVLVAEFAPFVFPSELSPARFLEDLFATFERVLDADEERGELTSTTPEHLLASYTRENERFTNLLCVTGCDVEPPGSP